MSHEYSLRNNLDRNCRVPFSSLAVVPTGGRFIYEQSSEFLLGVKQRKLKDMIFSPTGLADSVAFATLAALFLLFVFAICGRFVFYASFLTPLGSHRPTSLFAPTDGG